MATRPTEAAIARLSDPQNLLYLDAKNFNINSRHNLSDVLAQVNNHNSATPNDMGLL